MKILILFFLCNLIKANFVNFVLLGSTGDLSRRYLWDGLFQISQRRDLFLNVYGGGRKPTGAILMKAKQSKLNCDEKLSTNECLERKERFWGQTVFRTMKKHEHFRDLCEHLDKTGETIRIFYLSIPPYAFAQTAEWIGKYCLPQDQSIELRVAFEKPFGNSLKEAEQMLHDIKLEPHQCYLVDHYLGKPVVRDLVKFREGNYQDILVPSKISILDVYFHESLSAEGRTSFYDDVGVINDVMQNHVTEFYLRCVQELGELGIVAKNKALDESSKVFIKRAGQYHDYLSHLQAETERTSSTTPTAAEAIVTLEGWPDTKIKLSGAKAWKQKEVYARLAVKHDDDLYFFFFVASIPELSGSAFIIPRQLKKPQLEGWTIQEEKSGKFLKSFRLEDFWVLTPDVEIPAYHSVLTALIDGDESGFVRFSSVPKLWKMWDNPEIPELLPYGGPKKAPTFSVKKNDGSTQKVSGEGQGVKIEL